MAAMSTDVAFFYTNEKAGMIKRFTKIAKNNIYLPDFYRKTERLIKSKTSAWMTESFNLSSGFVSFIKLNLKIEEKSSDMTNIFNLNY